MEQAVEEATLSRARGNKGYGAVVVLGDEVLAKTHDTATSEGDPSLHAEFKAIREAIATVGSNDLCGAMLYSTCEPCPMCAGLAVWSNLTSIVYGASIADTARMGRSRILVGAAEIAERAPTVLEVIGGVLKDRCNALYSD
jgi:tRNA(Arg) A34 adenosine deaminase TadA